MKCLITGPSKGIGKHLSHLLPELIDVDLLLVSRTQIVDDDLRYKFPNSSFSYIKADLSNQEDLENLCCLLGGSSSPVQLLINNAAVYLDKGQTLLTNNAKDTLQRTLAINTIAPYRLIQTLLPKMRASNFGRIVNVSSGMSRLGEYNADAPSYRASKLALNGITVSVSYTIQDYDISCVSVCPGWVRTEMGGKDAIRSTEQACLGILWALLAPDTSMNGKFYRDDRALSLEDCTKNDYLDLGVPPNFAQLVHKRVLQFKEKYKL